MFFEVTDNGEPIRKRRYVFSESFAAIAMAEYAQVTGDKTYAEKALKIFKQIKHLTETPGLLPSKYCDSVKMQGHSLTMILINTASRIRQVISDPILDEQIEWSINQIRKYFIHPEFKALLETVGPNGEFLNTNMEGREFTLEDIEQLNSVQLTAILSAAIGVISEVDSHPNS